MSNLSTLKLSTISPRTQLSPVSRKRRKLLEQIDLQRSAADAALVDEEFLQEVRRWVRVEGSADKQLVTQKKPVRRWWWRNEFGVMMLSLRQGSRVLEIADGKQSIEVGQLSDLPEVLSTLRAAISAGELDERLTVPLAPPIPKIKRAKS